MWAGSPALPGFAPPPAERQRALSLVQQYRDANPVRVGASAPAAAAPPFTAASVPASPSALTRCQPCSQPASSNSTPSAISCSALALGCKATRAGTAPPLLTQPAALRPWMSPYLAVVAIGVGAGQLGERASVRTTQPHRNGLPPPLSEADEVALDDVAHPDHGIWSATTLMPFSFAGPSNQFQASGRYRLCPSGSATCRSGWQLRSST